MDETTSPSATPLSAEPVSEEFDLLCEQCGYSLVGLVESNRCPECGVEFDPTQLPLARVPWLYRVRLGKFRAYWRTVGYILFRPSSFATELCRPVRISVEDARAFRRRTIRMVLIPIVLLVLLPLCGLTIYNAVDSYGRSGRPGLLVERVLVALAMCGGTLFALWTLLTLGTDLPTFIWKGMGERASELAPVHHYAAAPLSIMPIFIPLIVFAGLWEYLAYRSYALVMARYVLASAVLLQVVLIGHTAAKLMRGATQCSMGRQIGLVAYLMLHWVLIAALSLMGWGLIVSGTSYVATLTR